jgi:hypothetical protein
MEYTLTFTKPDGRAESTQINTTESGSKESLFWVFKTIEERFSLIKKDKETISIILNDESDKSLKFPTKGVLFTKDYLKRLEYSQMNNLYEFTITNGKPKIYDNHFKIKYKKLNEEVNIMTYDEFINYLYTEGYIDEKPKQTKHK